VGNSHGLFRRLYASTPCHPVEAWQGHQWLTDGLPGYEKWASELAAELAVHFERGRDAEPALPYLRQAAQNAGWRSAHQEVLTHVTRGLTLLERWPDTPALIRHELRLHLSLAPPWLPRRAWRPLRWQPPTTGHARSASKWRRRRRFEPPGSNCINKA
jgi:hypothetical protein